MRVWQERRLTRAIGDRLWPVVFGARALVACPGRETIRIGRRVPIDPDPRKRGMVERILRSFRAMKQGQARAGSRYLPSPLWGRLLRESYAPALAALENGDAGELHRFLANFGVSPRYLGIDSTLVRRWVGSWFGRRYLEGCVFPRQLARWTRFYGGRKSLAALAHPRYGNLVGATVDGLFVGQEHVFFDEIYASQLRDLVAGVERPVIGELGGGYGEFAEYLVRGLDRWTYVDFDLPETLCLAAYYLMLALPGRRVLLFGEEPYSPKLHARYDIILMPSFEIEKLADQSVDVFVNKNSLGEMTREAVDNYVRHIARATRYFFHANHDLTPEHYSDGEHGVLARDYPVSPDDFTLVSRYLDPDHLLRRGWEDDTSDIFIHLYQRKSRGARSPAQER